jgi:hypothetical protein
VQREHPVQFARPPDAVREKEDMSPEEAVRRIARSAGAQASTSENTAEAVGERVGDAYSDAGERRANAEKGTDRRAGDGTGYQAQGAVVLGARRVP